MKKALHFSGIATALAILGSGVVFAQVNPVPVESMVIHQITDTIIIDGIQDEVYPNTFELTVLLTDPELTGQWSGNTDHQVFVTLGWRNEGIYILANITDDIDMGTPLDWQTDGIELKINPDKTNDGPDFEWMDDAWEIGVSRGVTDQYRFWNKYLGDNGDPAGGSADNGEICETEPLDGRPGVTFAIVNEEGSYTVEILLPWLFFLPNGATEDSIAVWRGREMGFDIHCPDKDDSNRRDHSIIWDADGTGFEADQANINTSLLGNITFGESLSILNSANTSGILVYPNPASDFVYLYSEQKNFSKIEFINMLGQTMKIVNIASQQEVNVDISDLPGSGCYFIRSSDLDGNVVSIKKLLVK